MRTWKATDILHCKGSHPLKVQRVCPLGVGNASKGTEQGVVYWNVLPSPRYAQKTGVHLITMVPETRLTPIEVVGIVGE